jgi:hypothetical protein
VHTLTMSHAVVPVSCFCRLPAKSCACPGPVTACCSRSGCMTALSVCGTRQELRSTSSQQAAALCGA